jgi:hypothetical protein
MGFGGKFGVEWTISGESRGLIFKSVWAFSGTISFTQNSMNIFELGFAALTLLAGVFGATKGFSSHGILGLIVGAIGGAAVGLAVAFAAIFCLAVIFKLFFGGTIFKPQRPSDRK